MNREIRRRTRAIGAFPDGNSALMLVCARLRHAAASEWGPKRYMDMEHLFKMEIEQPNDEENPYIWLRYLLADEMNLRKNLYFRLPIINFDRKPDNPAKIFPSQVPII